ncbi:hypothetical protein DEO72_LG10g1094 [Vigna unguiculata]|uniref:Uncharacterized protein n=1 Tax=Vigna unguiculata TaxID=3917 RepID=A0A4D6NAI1_VIGUN|nr:hypothetical protein DEO72_LG10g1094 [Vigna unguiculata]
MSWSSCLLDTSSSFSRLVWDVGPAWPISIIGSALPVLVVEPAEPVWVVDPVWFVEHARPICVIEPSCHGCQACRVCLGLSLECEVE